MKSRQFSGIRAKVPSACIRCCEKDFPITKASWEPESHLAHAPRVLEENLRHVATEDKLCKGARSEEAAQPIDGVLEDSWGCI